MRESRGIFFYLYEVGVPGILANMEVVVARILPSRLAEDVSWKKLSSAYDTPIVAREQKQAQGYETHDTSTRARTGEPWGRWAERACRNWY